MRLLIIAALALILVVAGCVTPVQKLGCCLKVNATSATNPGCVLYNTSDYQEYDEYFDNTVDCQNQTGCNVSIGGDYHMIPICTEADLVPCVNQDCTAMVCGGAPSPSMLVTRTLAGRARASSWMIDVDSYMTSASPT